MHNDIHQKNIGLKNTTWPHIVCFNKKVPTHGYLVYAIDFESSLHKKYKLKEYERYKSANDMFTILNIALFVFADLKYFYKKEKYEEYHQVNIAKEYAEILGYFLDKIQLTKGNQHFLMNAHTRQCFMKNMNGNYSVANLQNQYNQDYTYNWVAFYISFRIYMIQQK